MNPVIDHIQITVKDLNMAEVFYDKLMPLLGFDLAFKTKGRVAAHEFEVVEYTHPLLTFGVNSPRAAFKKDMVQRRKPGALHHLAFRAASCAEVDALFFKDTDGIKYEIVYEKCSNSQVLKK